MIRKRSHAREVALQLLFQHDLNPAVTREEVVRFVRQQLAEDELAAFALTLYDGASGRLPDIDERIGRAAENWRLARMAVIDRNIIRLGTHELDGGETPAGVVLNEAIELARRYGSADSPAFVNGVLDRLHRDAGAARAAIGDATAAAIGPEGPTSQEKPADAASPQAPPPDSASPQPPDAASGEPREQGVDS